MIKIAGKDLKKCAAKIAGFAGSYPALPILSFALLESEDGRLSITASDMESFLKVSIPAQGDTPLRTLVYGEMLKTIARDVEIALTFNGKSLVAESILGTHTIPTADVNDFPTPPIARKQHWTSTIPWSPQLASLCKATEKDAKTQAGTSLGGITIEREPHMLHIWSTDGYVLGHLAVPSEHQDTGWCFLPYRAIKTFLDLLPKESPISVTLYDEDEDEFFVTLCSSNVELTVRQEKQRNAFDYLKLYPNDSDKIAQASINAHALSSFLSSLPKETDEVLLLTNGGALIVFCEKIVCAAHLLAPSVSLKEPLKYKYSPRLLKKALAFLNSDWADLTLYGEAQPLLIKANNADCLVMPLKM